MVDVFQGISAFNGMLGVAKSLKDINDTVVRNQASIDLQGQIIAAQEAYATLLGEVRELKEKVASFESWESEKEKYELHNLAWGTFAYVLKPEERGVTPPHCLCAHCFEQKQKEIIQYLFVVGRGDQWMCPTCKREMRLDSCLVGGKMTWPP